MAILEKLQGRVRSVLLARHLIGRSRIAQLRLPESMVSGEHATLRWTGQQWEIHDLGSRNGTWVDGRRLASGERAALAAGALPVFGHRDNTWRLVDDGPPATLALPEGEPETGSEDDSGPLYAKGDLLALPDDEAPEAVVYRDPTGEWVLEQGGETTRATDGQIVIARARRFVLHIPAIVASTWDAVRKPPRLEELTLRFTVSRDEEYVTLTALGQGHSIDLGARAHHAVLLALARSRLQDQEPARATGGAALPESAQGWVYQDELARMLDMDETHVNVTVFRCRRQLAEAGILGAANIVERRRPTRQLRLGVERIEITPV